MVTGQFGAEQFGADNSARTIWRRTIWSGQCGTKKRVIRSGQFGADNLQCIHFLYFKRSINTLSINQLTKTFHYTISEYIVLKPRRFQLTKTFNYTISEYILARGTSVYKHN